MIITSYRLIVVELLGKPLIKTISKVEKGHWECEPEWAIGSNSDGDTVQNITLTIKRRKGDKEVILKTRTSFILTLANKDVVPTTPQDFEFYTLITHMACAHARVIFKYEMKGTSFANDLLPQDSNEAMMLKVKMGLLSSNRGN